jgi:hypothetical protein
VIALCNTIRRDFVSHSVQPLVVKDAKVSTFTSFDPSAVIRTDSRNQL